MGGGRAHGDGFGILAAALNLDADAGSASELVHGEAAAGFARAGRRPRWARPSQSPRESQFADWV